MKANVFVLNGNIIIYDKLLTCSINFIFYLLVTFTKKTNENLPFYQTKLHTIWFNPSFESLYIFYLYNCIQNYFVCLFEQFHLFVFLKNNGRTDDGLRLRKTTYHLGVNICLCHENVYVCAGHGGGELFSLQTINFFSRN